MSNKNSRQQYSDFLSRVLFSFHGMRTSGTETRRNPRGRIVREWSISDAYRSVVEPYV